ncbi:MFS transporter [Pelistega ratti]|uniref:MFS transporter n=1 Tax=Pelistega ratti TaxID=2652177 RepID=UPI001358534B|nr:MFS transporter [Pelistega ratti]
MAITEKITATNAPLSQEPDGLPTPQRYWAALTLLLTIAMGVVDSSITNIALPTISRSLNVPPASIVWVINAYTIAIIALLLPFSALAEQIGMRRLLRIGLVIFMLGAVGSMFANSLTHLLITRIIQGIGCSACMALFGGLVRHIYPRHALATGISLNAMVVGASALISPSLGAFIIEIASWHWIYGFSIPLSIIALVFTIYIPRIHRIKKPFDYSSAILNALALGCFVAALDIAFYKPSIALLFVFISILSGYLLYQRCIRQTAPLVPLDLLKIIAFRDAIIVSSLSFATASLTMISAPFYFQTALHMSTKTVGLLFSAWPVASLLIAPIAAHLSNKYPTSVLAGTGSVIISMSLLSLLLLPKDAPTLYFGLCLFFAGLGFGFFQTPNNKAILLSAPSHRASATGGMQSTARLFGQCIGAALVGLSFSMSAEHGHYYGLILGFIMITIASAVNLSRYIRKTDIAVY